MPSSSFAVMISISASFVTISEASTRTPSIFPATVAFAKPGPISDAISSIDRGFSNFPSSDHSGPDRNVMLFKSPR